jgi:hypothetical protein
VEKKKKLKRRKSSSGRKKEGGGGRKDVEYLEIRLILSVHSIILQLISRTGCTG